MNKEYIYSNGKAIVVDENHNMTMVNYYDNLCDVLIQENIIEQMAKSKIRLEQELKELRDYKPNSKLKILLNNIITIGISIFLTNELLNIISLLNEEIASLILLPYVASIFIGISPVLFTLKDSVSKYRENKEVLREFRGKEVELEILTKDIEDAKEDLENLKNNKTYVENEYLINGSRVNDLKSLKRLRDCLTFYNDLGYFEDKYLKYYRRGNLEKKLKKEYSDEEVDFAMEYFEESSPRLVKSRK